GQDVLLDGQVDGIRVDAGQVQADVEAVTPPVGIHRHRGRAGGGAEHLLGEPVQFAERVGAHEHDRYLLVVSVVRSRSQDLYSTPVSYLTTLDSDFLLGHTGNEILLTGWRRG